MPSLHQQWKWTMQGVVIIPNIYSVLTIYYGSVAACIILLILTTFISKKYL